MTISVECLRLLLCATRLATRALPTTQFSKLGHMGGEALSRPQGPLLVVELSLYLLPPSPPPRYPQATSLPRSVSNHGYRCRLLLSMRRQTNVAEGNVQHSPALQLCSSCSSIEQIPSLWNTGGHISCQHKTSATSCTCSFWHHIHSLTLVWFLIVSAQLVVV